MGAPRDYSHTFSGAGTNEILLAGRYIRVLEAPSAALFIRVSAGSELKRVAGQAIDAGPDGFTRFSIRSTVAQTILLVVSDTPQDDNQQTVNATVNATVAPGNTVTTTADAAVLTVATSQVLAGRADRLAVIVKNLNGNAALIRVGESASVGAARGHEVLPGESITLVTTAAIFVYNSHTGTQSVSLIEVREV